MGERRTTSWIHKAIDAAVVLTVISVAGWVPLRLLYGPLVSGADAAVDLASAAVVAAAWLQRRSRSAEMAGPWHKVGVIAIDLALALPLDWLAQPWLGEHASRLLLVKLLMLARIAQVRAWFETLASRHPVLHRLVPLLLYLPPFVHLLACGWIALGSGSAGRDSDPVQEYVRAVYWTLTTLTTVGYGDITPRTMVQMLYVCGTQVLGVGVFGFVISNVASVLTRLDAAREHHMSQLDRLETYMNYNRLPGDLRAQVREYFRYMWDTRQGYQDSEVLTGLPAKLRGAITMHLNRDMVRKIPLLRGAGDSFVQDLMEEMQAMVAVPGERIFAAGEPGDGMYFIRSGAVAIVTASGEVVATLHAGNFFGEMSLLSGAPRSASAVASDYCDLFRLTRAGFERAVQHDPQFAATLRASARARDGSAQDPQTQTS
ncbi:MAG: cyclic nucleotide-binding domain-containing protein [Deltaproteobacteria bacterium]|nr:cyclic nucleotide-binding domain-containing protein [Deltaproteobacteria bacterium]